LAASVLIDTVIRKFNFAPEVADFKNIRLVNSLADSILVLGRLNLLFNTAQFRSISFFNYEPLKGIYYITNNGGKLSFRLKENISEEEYNYLNETLKNGFKGLDSDNLHISYGVWLFNKGLYSRAHREFFIAREQDPYNTKAINNMAIMENQLGKTDKAIELLKLPNARKTYNNLVCQNLWILYKQQNKTKEAKEVKKIIDKEKFHVSSSKNLTLAY
jgi:hypothetical protein